MTLKEYITHLNKIIEAWPEAENFDLIYAKDDEGNDYQGVSYTPSVVWWDSANQELSSEEDGDKRVVCIN